MLKLKKLFIISLILHSNIFSFTPEKFTSLFSNGLQCLMGGAKTQINNFPVSREMIGNGVRAVKENANDFFDVVSDGVQAAGDPECQGMALEQMRQMLAQAQEILSKMTNLASDNAENIKKAAVFLALSYVGYQIAKGSFSTIRSTLFGGKEDSNNAASVDVRVKVTNPLRVAIAAGLIYSAWKTKNLLIG